MSLQALIEETVAALKTAGLADPPYEARQLVQEALDISFAQIVSRPERELDPAMIKRVREWTKRRASGEPLAYLSRRRGFYKNDFIVEPGVLVPRPETELIVETALRRLDEKPDPVGTIADLGCGSGCIGLSLLLEFSAAHLNAIDPSGLAVKTTEANAAALGLEERVSVEQTRVEQWRPNHRFDLIVANPPYISENDPHVEPGVRNFEPALALFSGEDGLEALRTWAEWSYRHLAPGGLYVCEFGAGQSRSVEGFLTKVGFKQLQTERDLSGMDRVTSGVR